MSARQRREGVQVELGEFQHTIRTTYGSRDRQRGVDATFGWFVEEVGELSRAIRREGHQRQVEEFSDAFAWLVSLADLCGVDMCDAAARYAEGCPKCGETPCSCRGDEVTTTPGAAS